MQRTRVHALPRMRVRSALGTVALVLALGQTAYARVETLRWSHPNVANVDGFKLHTGASPGAYTTTIDAGKPSSSNGVFSYNLASSEESVGEFWLRKLPK